MNENAVVVGYEESDFTSCDSVVETGNKEIYVHAVGFVSSFPRIRRVCLALIYWICRERRHRELSLHYDDVLYVVRFRSFLCSNICSSAFTVQFLSPSHRINC